VKVATQARATLVERHAGGHAAALCSSLVQVELAPAARLVHYRVQAGASDALQFDALFARLHDEAEYQLFQLDIGGGAVRHGLQLNLSGRDARLDLQALALGRGATVIDSSIDLHHAGRGSRSTQCLRAIANDQSGLSYNSRVEVGTEAAGSQSRQSLKGLLGGARAEINLRPQLEINTDDVQASHGATTGALDANMMFYLLSRGIDPATARQLLEWAFAEDVMSRIAVEPLRRQVEQAALASLDNAAAREAQS
jgi:Fe-S cluster assembly protein SufD